MSVSLKTSSDQVCLLSCYKSLVFKSWNNHVAFSWPVSSSSILSQVLTPRLGSFPTLGSSEHFSPTPVTHLRTASSLSAEQLSLAVMLTHIFQVCCTTRILQTRPPVLLAWCQCFALDVQPCTEQHQISPVFQGIQLSSLSWPAVYSPSKSSISTLAPTLLYHWQKPPGNAGTGTDTFMRFF